MARGKAGSNPVKGGVRKRRNTQPGMTSMSSDSSIVKYSVLGLTMTTNGALGSASYYRSYIPGNSNAVTNGSGPSICSYYSTGKFMPGTRIRWEPSVAFTTSGRVHVGFTDNPELMATLNVARATYENTPTAANYTAYANLVKSLGTVRSFPVWQETDIEFPLDTRRKRFDTNIAVDYTNADVLDRSAQRGMYVCADGGPTTGATVLGSFWYHDVVSVEGVTGITS